MIGIAALSLGWMLIFINFLGFIFAKILPPKYRDINDPVFGRRIHVLPPGICNRSEEPIDVFVNNVTRIINEYMVHYKKEPYNRCPFFENYILYLLSFSPIAHFKNYEFYSIKTILKIGHGWCSQVSILLYQILIKNDISCRIIGFKGHVLVEVSSNNQIFLADPDYGVILPSSAGDLKSNLSLVENIYGKLPISKCRIDRLKKIYCSQYSVVPPAVINRNLVIEKIAYILKWHIPLLLVLLSLLQSTT